MDRDDFNTIATNTVIMRKIFRHLNFEEQLQFAQVSQQLRYFFTNVIWTVNYEKLSIVKDMPDFHIHHDTKVRRLRINVHELRQFVKVYGADVKELNETCNPVMDLRGFPNLTALSYSDMYITKPQLQNVVKYCKRLEKLRIYNCVNIRRGVFKMPQDFEIKTLLEMKKLKSLSVASSRLFTLKYKHFQEMVLKSNIKHLSLKYNLEPIKKLPQLDSQLGNNLEELEIFTTFSEVAWGNNLPHFLQHFKNLLVLTIRMEEIIDNEIIKVLSETCQQLKKLSINSTTFDKVNNFILLVNLEELHIDSCIGLKHSNLRQILSNMNLLRFSTLQTKYEGKFENFPISKNLQYLNVYIMRKFEFKTIYVEENSLQTLVWDDDCYDSENKPLLLKCNNLEYLEIKSGAIELENVMQLTALRSFSIECPALNFSWFYIIQVLKHHVSLTEFILEHPGSALEMETPPDEAFECAPNIKCIKISPNVFKLSIDFWLDFLWKNRKLRLVCFGLFTTHFMRNILNSPKFPSFLRIIYINGFRVAIRDLRKNFDYMMEKIGYETKHPQEAAHGNNYGIEF